MKLTDFILNLQMLEQQGNGELEVMYRHGSSGDCGKLSSAYITCDVDDCGPFDLDDEWYVSVYAGN
jgi:hypothetical protein